MYNTHGLLRIYFFKMRLANYSLVGKSGPSPIFVLPRAKSGFYIFHDLRKKIKRSILFYDM